MKTMADLQNEQVKIAIEMFKNGVPVSRIADKIGCTSVTVYKWLDEAGVRKREKVNTKKFTDKQKEKALKMYQNGYKLKDISDEIGAAVMTIYNWILRSDVEIRKRNYSRKYPQEIVEKAVEMYKNGFTIEQIAIEIGCSDYSVRSWIDKSDVPFRRTSDYKRHFSKEDKKSAVEMFKNGKKYIEIAAEIGCSVTLVRLWIENNRL